MRDSIAGVSDLLPPFRSFVQGGFEGSSLQFHDGRRVDPIAETQHDLACASDYRLLGAHGIHTVRDTLRWYKNEPERGIFDWTDFRRMLDAAEKTNVQVIWDLCHFGLPHHVDMFADSFPEQFGDYAVAAAQVLGEHTDEAPWWCPVNEISYWAHAAGADGFMHPARLGTAELLKQQLVRAWLIAAERLRAVDSRARFLATDPLIHVTHKHDGALLAAVQTQASFEAFDALLGRDQPELGGHSNSIDVLGLNFYPHNQWCVEDQQTVGLGMNGYRPLHLLMQDVWDRYHVPLMISETGAEGSSGPAWLRYVASEVNIARAAGVPVLGLCIYPVMDYPAWVDGRQCRTGLIECVGYDRRVCPDMAAALTEVQALRRRNFPAPRLERQLKLVT